MLTLDYQAKPRWHFINESISLFGQQIANAPADPEAGQRGMTSAVARGSVWGFSPQRGLGAEPLVK